MSEQFIVQGNIFLEDRRPVSGVLVRAVDKDLPSRDLRGNGRRSEEPLGEARTDMQGHYEIAYTAGQFLRAEKESADLVIRVFGPNNRQFGMSDVRFQAPPNATMDLVIVPQAE